MLQPGARRRVGYLGKDKGAASLSRRFFVTVNVGRWRFNTMQKKQVFFAILIVVSVGLGVAVEQRYGVSNPGAGARPEAVSNLPDGASNGVQRSEKPGSGSNLDPERGIWPGMPELASSNANVDWRPPDFDSAVAGGEDLDAVDPKATLLELVDDFDDLSPDRRGGVAFKIAENWRECARYRPVPDEQIGELVEQRLRGSHDFLELILAQAPEGPRLDEVVEEIAGIEPDAIRVRIREDLLTKRQLCSGVEHIDRRERAGKELSWLRTAARLGDYDAQNAFLFRVFLSYRPSGQAAQLAKDKQLVLDIVFARLRSRDLLVLERLAAFVKAGYFGPPDPVLAYAYAKAAILAGERLEDAPWKLRGADPARVKRVIEVTAFNTREFKEALSASDLAEAEDLARKIARLESRP